MKELERRKAKEVIPTVVKGEIARLNSKFNVKVQKNQSETGDIKILCFLSKKPFCFKHCRFYTLLVKFWLCLFSWAAYFGTSFCLKHSCSDGCSIVDPRVASITLMPRYLHPNWPCR